VNRSQEISKKFGVCVFQIQGDSGGKVIVLGGDSIGHCLKKSSNEHVANSEWLLRYNCLNLVLCAHWIFIGRVG
jgi:hypothetical protein